MSDAKKPATSKAINHF